MGEILAYAGGRFQYDVEIFTSAGIQDTLPDQVSNHARALQTDPSGQAVHAAVG